jgi:methylmalonyl-CoA/ethylmalonyl-CoA epimerase
LDSQLFRFHHMGVAVPSLDKALSQYRNLFQYELISGPFDDPIQGVSVCFLQRSLPGDFVIELVAPLGPESPIQQTLRRGGGAYHVCYEVDDLDAALAHCLAQGCIKVSDPVPAVAFSNRRIAWLFTQSRQLTELVESGATR